MLSVVRLPLLEVMASSLYTLVNGPYRLFTATLSRIERICSIPSVMHRVIMLRVAFSRTSSIAVLPLLMAKVFRETIGPMNA